MRDAAHVDGGQHGFTNGSVLKQCFGGTNRLVIAHVLVYCENDTGFFTGLHSFNGLGIIRTQRFLSENPFHGAPGTGSLNDLKLIVRGDSNVENFDGIVIQELVNTFKNITDIILFCALSSIILCSGGDGHWVEAGFPVSGQMTIIHNKATANTANTPIFTFRKWRMDIKIHEAAFSPAPVVSSVDGFQNSVFASNNFPFIALIAVSGNFSRGS